MESFITQNLFSIILSALMTLVLYIFNRHGKRIDDVEKVCRMCPIHSMSGVIAEIRTDLKWIKEKLDKL